MDEKNKIIAEYMGYKRFVSEFSSYIMINPANGEKCLAPSYDERWDYLIPVIQKLHSNGIKLPINILKDSIKDLHEIVYQSCGFPNIAANAKNG